MRVTRASHRLPPASNGIDCEARRVVVDPDAHPPGIVGDVVDAVGRRPTELRDDEVVHADRFGPTLRAVLTPTIAEIAHQFLLLGVDRNRRLIRRQRLLHLSVDVPELGIAVGMLRPLAGLAIGLQAVPKMAQKIGDHVVRDAMPETSKLDRQIAQALGGPPQRRHRIAACRRLHQGSEIAEQRRIGVHEGRAAGDPSGAPDPAPPRAPPRRAVPKARDRSCCAQCR